MFAKKETQQLLHRVKNEQFPDLQPLLRYLSSISSSQASPGAMDLILDALDATNLRSFFKSFAHGLILEACSKTNGETVHDQDVFSPWEKFEISAPCYHSFMLNLNLDPSTLKCFYSIRDWYAQPACLGKLLPSSLGQNGTHAVESQVTDAKDVLLGAALSKVSCPLGQVPCLQNVPVLEKIIFFLMDLVTLDELDRILYEGCIDIILCLLESWTQRETQIELLSHLAKSTTHRVLCTRLEKESVVCNCVQKEIVVICNQMMELNAVHEGVLSDEELREEHLQNWISKLFPLMVLFPMTVTNELISTALSNSAQQQLITKILDRFTPIVVIKERDYIIEALKMDLLRKDSVLSNNICALVKECLSPSAHRMHIFVREVCIPVFESMSYPTNTIEGLIQFCVWFYHSAKEMVDQVEIDADLIISLSATIETIYSCRWCTYQPYKSFVLNVETLMVSCIHSMAQSTKSLSQEKFDHFKQLYLALNWKIRILMSPVLLKFSSCEDLTILFCTAEHENFDEAYLWVQKLAEYLLVYIASKEHKIIQLQKHLEDIKQALLFFPVELISWSMVMALVDLTLDGFQSCLHQIWEDALPSLLRILQKRESLDESLLIEIFCRSLFVIGTSSTLSEMESAFMLSQGVSRLAVLCKSMLESCSDQDKENFILRSCQEICNLLTSIEHGMQYETSDLQMVLIQLVQSLVEISTKDSNGMLLPSGVSVKVVIQWLMTLLGSLKQNSRNNMTRAVDLIIGQKQKLCK